MTRRHGGGMERVPVDQIEIAVALPEDRLVQVSDALDETEREASGAAQIVKLRYFVGLTQEEVADTMGHFPLRCRTAMDMGQGYGCSDKSADGNPRNCSENKLAGFAC